MRKSDFTAFKPLCVIFTFGLMLSIVFTGCNNNSEKVTNSINSGYYIVNADDSVPVAVAEETTVDEEEVYYMRAPKIKTDEYGLITLSQCPEKDSHLRVDISREKNKARIYYDTKLIQTFSDPDEDPLATDVHDKCPVRFLDANFDGFADIFIGQGLSRTYSCLLLWDSTSKQFFRVGNLGEPSLQNLTLHPASKSVYEGGSNSWCNTSFTRSTWDDRQLVKQEELNIVTDPSEYQNYQVNKKYTVKYSQNDKVVAADSPSALPSEWQSIAKIFSE